MTYALPQTGGITDSLTMTRMTVIFDAMGLALDDLWSYYEVAGRPGAAYLAPICLMGLGLIFIVMA